MKGTIVPPPPHMTPPPLQVFDFQHGLLFGEMNRLQVSAVHTNVTHPLELSFWGSAPTPVLQVTQGSRHTQHYHAHREPTRWPEGRHNSRLINYASVS